MGRFTGKVAVVTGSGRRKGLGEAIVLKLAEEGATIVVSDIGGSRDAATPDGMIGATEEMESIAADVRALGGGASTFVCDVREPAQVNALAMRAAADRRRDEHQERTWQTWHVAAFQRAKRMPSLPSVLGDRPVIKAMTPDEVKAVFRTMREAA